MRCAAVWILLVGCGTSAPSEAFDCSTATDADPFAAGFSKVGDAGEIDFSLVVADPVQPTSGDNNWTIQLLATATGDAVANAQLTVQAMPDRTHPLSDPVALTPLATPGRFLIVPHLWRAGVWDAIITVAGATRDGTVFRVCAAR